ncbi:hypothetical protein BJ973_002771 [Actinoplanes tereljensis]|uniref:NACHT domain-containing protein n=1 Tax=Paractinoplanes tereljensis TaxID=571912 RepID=A0A919NP54_9ACTN|nr:NACHT domain-containing protein [Actinoplanes tereljensis]GIF22450.1 hypothetical protein Ate02nite_51800 [Actinoplanes tereljensis]
MKAFGATLRVLARSANEKGDVMTRLAADLFYALGYDDLKFDVAKSGREVDITGAHRLENRGVRAECKAQEDPIGGSDINKFYGVLDAERRTSNVPIEGYFVSVSGFRSSALEQERSFGQPRITLLDGGDVVSLLEERGVIVSRAVAAEAAGRLVSRNHSSLVPEPDIELLASSKGWLWAIYYRAGDARQAVCVVHSDGQVLSEAFADYLGEFELPRVITADDPATLPDTSDAKAAYLRYILAECGVLSLEGMPADEAIVSKPFKLESLYVAALLEEIDDPRDTTATSAGHPAKASPVSMEVRLGDAFSEYSKLAILGLPGAGKSTLIKRLAVAYADPSRLNDSNDNLPPLRLFPVLIRCRRLGSLVERPIRTVIDDQILRAERPDLSAPFSALIGELLRGGGMMLLIDGLDEISDPSQRIAFTSQLRTFVATYPDVRIVLTSREFGFRPVAGAVASVCKTMRVAELGNDGIANLVLSWNREVVGKDKETEQKAYQLVDEILEIDRVRTLATNPLLLTTLLLVRRWAGQLPRQRSVLYRKAIELLLATWNTEGHEAIDPDEALPQLAYTAYSMMIAGSQRVSSGELRRLFRESRRQMPDVLGFAKVSVGRLVDRIEERSSLLNLHGYEVIAGSLESVYEFKHLTFQEYLCALSITNEWLPEELNETPLLLRLRPYLADPRWQEVVTLSAALSGRKGSTIVEELVRMARLPEVSDGDVHTKEQIDTAVVAAENLVDCMADEIAMSPEVARLALDALFSNPGFSELALDRIVGSRYDKELYRTCHDYLLRDSHVTQEVFHILENLVGRRFDSLDDNAVPIQVHQLLGSENRAERVDGLALALHAILQSPFSELKEYVDRNPGIRQIAYSVAEFASQSIESYEFAGVAWILGWSGVLIEEQRVAGKLQDALLSRWRLEVEHDDSTPHIYLLPWAICSLPASRLESADIPDGALEFLRMQFGMDPRQYDSREREKLACLKLGYRLGGPWSDEEILGYLRQEDLFVNFLTKQAADFVKVFTFGH